MFSTEAVTSKQGIKRKLHIPHCAKKVIDVVGKPIDVAGQHSMISGIGVPYHAFGSQIGDDRRMQGIVAIFGGLKAFRKCVLRFNQLAVLVDKSWPIGFCPTEKIAENCDLITEPPPQDAVQILITHILQQWLSFAQTISNTVLQRREIDCDESIGSDQIAIVRQWQIVLQFEIFYLSLRSKLPASWNRVNRL